MTSALLPICPDVIRLGILLSEGSCAVDLGISEREQVLVDRHQIKAPTKAPYKGTCYSKALGCTYLHQTICSTRATQGCASTSRSPRAGRRLRQRPGCRARGRNCRGRRRYQAVTRVKARAQLCAVDLDISEREQVFVNRLQI